MPRPAANPTYFATPQDFRAWLQAHHSSAKELVVGFHKVGTGKPSITWPQAVDEALCFGWIDGVRRSLGSEAYTIRFTPRQARSTWSAVNIGRVKALLKEGRMTPAGERAFAARADERSAIYSYEQRKGAALTKAQEKALRAVPKAWAFWQAQPPSYRKAAAWWLASAKKDETRAKRLATLVRDSAAGRTVKPFTRPTKGARPPSRAPPRVAK